MSKQILYSMILVIFTVMSCGESEQKKEENLKASTKLTLFGKTLNVEDNLYELSCNEFFIKFLYSRSNQACTAVTVTNDYSGNWTIKSSDDTIDLSPTELTDTNQLVIGDETYFCYLYSGSLFKNNGEEVYFETGHLVLSKSSASKPSDLNVDDVDYIGGQSALCEALY